MLGYVPIKDEDVRNLQVIERLQEDDYLMREVNDTRELLSKPKWQRSHKDCQDLLEQSRTLSDMIVHRADILIVTKDSARDDTVALIVKTCHFLVIDEASQAPCLRYGPDRS
ncbi:hypothetical protein PG991_012138 [Apiospora marii]|uniref:DNA2/NAM7 helicase helicase domain-containing protein n=1 Tax=Apiospora marii TaxID=335849 RepID=A0ABR1R8Z9_9PEZI